MQQIPARPPAPEPSTEDVAATLRSAGVEHDPAMAAWTERMLKEQRAWANRRTRSSF